MAGVLHWVQEFFHTLKILRAPLILGVISLLLLSLPAQVIELYLILARDWRQKGFDLALASASLVALCFFLALVSRALTQTDEDVNAQRREHSAQGAITRNLPWVVGLLPLFGATLGLLSARSKASTEVLNRAAETIAAFQTSSTVNNAFKAYKDWFRSEVAITDAEAASILQSLNYTVPETLLKLPSSLNQLNYAIWFGIAACAVAGLLLITIFAGSNRQSIDSVRHRLFHPVTCMLVLLIFACAIAVFAAQAIMLEHSLPYDFTMVPRALGTLTIVNLSLILLLLLGSMLTRVSDRTKIPLLSILLVAGLVFSFFDWNDNHDVRLLHSTDQEMQERALGKDGRLTLFTDAFKSWLDKRPTDYVKKFEGKPYPIYIAAAQGGGMYAANLSGLALARVYDRCPAIRHHLFAISGVSGGSVGAGFLSAVLNDPAYAPTADTCDLKRPTKLTQTIDKGPIESRMEKLLQTDFLSPVAASFLFPDLLQRLLPFPVKAFDRARAFEASLEQAWDGIMKAPNPLRRQFWQHWRPDGASPMLFLNTTIVDTGHQIAISPVEIDPNQAPNALQLQSMSEIFNLDTRVDIPLSAAISLSARFPVVMPAGRLTLVRRDARLVDGGYSERSPRSVRLVDGGYFENSGTEAGLSLVERLKQSLCDGGDDYSNCVARSKASLGQTDLAAKAYAFKLIVFSDYDALSNVLSEPSLVGSGLNEIMSPVRSMYNARIARGELIVGRMENFSPSPGARSKASGVPTVIVSLNPNLYFLPLGWQLSEQAQTIISLQIGEPEHCRYGVASPAYKQAWLYAAGADHGLQVMKHGKNFKLLTYPKDGVPSWAWRTPFLNMFYTLKSNQCSIFGALIADGVAPRQGSCVARVKSEASSSSQEAAISVAKKKWVDAVDQQHGKAWSILENADGYSNYCEPNSFRCSIEAWPCNPDYQSEHAQSQ